MADGNRAEDNLSTQSPWVVCIFAHRSASTIASAPCHLCRSPTNSSTPLHDHRIARAAGSLICVRPPRSPAERHACNPCAVHVPGACCSLTTGKLSDRLPGGIQDLRVGSFVDRTVFSAFYGRADECGSANGSVS